MRVTLCAFLCALTIVVSLATAAIQSRNRERGIALDAVKRECDMLEAVNGDRCQRILAQDSRPIPLEPPAAKAPDARDPGTQEKARTEPRAKPRGETALAAASGGGRKP
jgi:hypothetical protein